MRENEKIVLEPAPPQDNKARRILCALSCLACCALLLYYAVSCFTVMVQFISITESTYDNLLAAIFLGLISSVYVLVFFALGAICIVPAVVYLCSGITLLKGFSNPNAANKKKKALLAAFIVNILALLISAVSFSVYLGRVIVHGPEEHLSAFFQLGLLPFALSALNTVFNRMTNASLKAL